MPSVARDTWSCDFCGTEGFISFDEANEHEKHECQQASTRKRQRPGPPGHHPAGLNAAVAEEMGGDYDQRPRRIAIMAPNESHQHQMDISDVLACQNLEVFEAGPEFEGYSRRGHIARWQVGIRCIHCVQQPTNELNMYFPGSIQAMGSAIQMVADRHVIHCPAVPGQVREELQRAYEKRRRDQEESRSDVEEERNRMALTAYCSMFCRNCSIVDRYAPESGLSFADWNPRIVETPRQPIQPAPGRPDEMSYPPSAWHRGPFPPMMQHMMGDNIAATPLTRSSKDQDRSGQPLGYGEREGYATPYSVGGPRGMYPEAMSAQTPHTRPDTESEGPPSQHGPPPDESPGPGYTPFGPSPYVMPPAPHQGEFPFYQDANGSWSCRYCSSYHPQYRDHGATWNGPEPPPGNFIGQHLHACRAFNHAMMPAQPTFQGHPPQGYPPYQPPPHFSGQGPPHAQGMGTPGVPPHASAPMQPHYSTPHSDSDAPFHYRLEDHKMGLSRIPRGPPSRPVHMRLASGDMAAQQAIEYLSAADKRGSAYRGDLLGGESDQLVLDEDRLLLTDYFFHLMKQLRVCRFTEADRKTRGGKRENIAVGYGGLQCIHCAEAANARKFFWSTVDRLANSFAEIPSHVLKCRRCPNDTKRAILELKTRHSDQMAKLPRGSQKVFFRRMWRRLHDSDPKTEGTPPDEKEAEEQVIVEMQQPPVGEQKVEPGSPASHILERMGSSPGTSTDDSAIMLERPTDEAAKALAASATASTSDPPSPSSRVLLGIPEDKEWLSDMDCFVRHNLEVFCATQEDVDIAQQDRKYPVNVGQIGIRCIHCGLAKEGEGARGSAVAFPYSISGIYESVREFQRLHLDSCPNLPPVAKQRLAGKKGSSSLSSVLRKYYVLAAKALGLYDTPDGIRCGAEAVPLGPNAAFAFAEATSKVSEEMRKGGGPLAAFVEETGPSVTQLESRKRKHSEEPSGDASEGEVTTKKES